MATHPLNNSFECSFFFIHAHRMLLCCRDAEYNRTIVAMCFWGAPLTTSPKCCACRAHISHTLFPKTAHKPLLTPPPPKDP